MAVTPDDVRDIAPEFTAQADARITRFINRAKGSVNEDVFGRVYDLAVTYLAAHMLSVSNDPTSGGSQISQVVTGEKVGDLSRNYQTTESITETSLDRTKYGQEFARLRKQCVTSPVVITQSGELDE